MNFHAHYYSRNQEKSAKSRVDEPDYDETIELQVTEEIPWNAHVKFDGKRYVGDPVTMPGDQTEGQPPLFRVRPGAHVDGLFIDPPAGDGIHVYADPNARPTILENIYFGGVGEDAISIISQNSTAGNLDAPRAKVLIQNCVFRNAEDKVIQFKDFHGEVKINNCFFKDCATPIRDVNTLEVVQRIFVNGCHFEGCSKVCRLSNPNSRLYMGVSTVKGWDKNKGMFRLDNGAKAYGEIK